MGDFLADVVLRCPISLAELIEATKKLDFVYKMRRPILSGATQSSYVSRLRRKITIVFLSGRLNIRATVAVWFFC